MSNSTPRYAQVPTPAVAYGAGAWPRDAQHTAISVDRGDHIEYVVVFDASPADVSVTAGLQALDASPACTVGTEPQCAAATGDGDRCRRDADWQAGAETCWQHDTAAIPDAGWPADDSED